MSGISTCMFSRDFWDQKQFLMRFSHTLQRRKLMNVALSSKASHIGSYMQKGGTSQHSKVT
jgi:hypothetical protein